MAENDEIVSGGVWLFNELAKYNKLLLFPKYLEFF